MEPSTPPAAPPPAASTTSAQWPRAPRQLEAGRGASWWGEGWKIFLAAPWPWVGIAIIFVLIHVLLSFIPVLGNIASTILGPIFAGGLLLGCHGLARGRPLAIVQMFQAFQTDRLVPLALLGAIAFGVGLVIGLFAMVLMFGGGMMGMLGSGLGSLSSPNFGAAAMGMGVMGLLAAVVAVIAFVLFGMAFWFAPALVMLNRAEPIEALKASFGASLANLGAMIVFGLIGLVLAIVASIPMALGWLVLLPVGIGASYASWREVFGN